MNKNINTEKEMMIMMKWEKEEKGRREEDVGPTRNVKTMRDEETVLPLTEKRIYIYIFV
jgi:hypothetical protein